MFYSQLLLSKKGPLGTIWIAAHCHKRLKKEQVQQTNITSSVDKILLDEAPVVTYRILGYLLLGVVRIYSKKVEYLFHDCNHALVKLGDFATHKRSTSKLSAVHIDGMHAPKQTITRPKKFELDNFELEILENQDASSGHVASREEIMLSDARRDEQTGFGLSKKYGEDISCSEPLTMDHTPVRDIRSPHLVDKDYDVRPSVGTGHLAAMWNLNETRFSLEERFEPMTFEDIEIQMTSDKSTDHRTENEQMKESNGRNLVNKDHLYEKKSSSEGQAEPMIITDAEAEPNNDQQSEKIRQPIGILEHPDRGANVGDEGPAGHVESFLEEEYCVDEQKKKAKASSSRNRKDRTKDDHSVSLCVDVNQEIKLSGSSSPDFISVRTPATKERTRISRKRKCRYDGSIVIPNDVYKDWIRDANDLVCKRKKVPHTSYLVWRAHTIASLPQSLKDPLFPCVLSIDIISARCKHKSTADGPAETVEVCLPKDIPESPNTVKSLEQISVPPATSLHEDILIAPATSLQEEIIESPGTLRCGELIPTAPAAASLHVGIPESPNTLRYDGEQIPIAPATPVTGSCSLRFHEMHGISRSHIEPESSAESRERGAFPMEDQELIMNLMDEEINSFEGDTSERYDFSLRTRMVARFLLEKFSARKGKEKVEAVNLSLLLKGKTKRESARVFYETLVLKSGGWIDVRQDDPYGDILLQEVPTLKQTFEADESIHPKS